MRDDYPCQAGRLADFGGRWLVPCPDEAEEALAFSEEVGLPRVAGTPVLMLCGAHMAELMAAGLIDEPMVGVEEWIARVDQR
jgi:hypothetical protein